MSGAKKIACDKGKPSRFHGAVTCTARVTRRPARGSDRPIAKVGAPRGEHVAASAMLSSIDFPIVGVGASAGGLDAFAELLSGVPVNTPLTLVLVQHLDSTFALRALLGGWIARTTTAGEAGRSLDRGRSAAPNPSAQRGSPSR